MAIYDNDGTTSREIGKLYDSNDSVSSQIGKVYDNDGTTSRLIYNAESVVIGSSPDNTIPYSHLFGAASWESTDNSFTNGNDRITLVSESNKRLAVTALNGTIGYVAGIVFSRLVVPSSSFSKMTVTYGISPQLNTDGPLAFRIGLKPAYGGTGVTPHSGAVTSGRSWDLPKSKTPGGTTTIDISAVTADWYLYMYVLTSDKGDMATFSIDRVVFS